MFLKRLVQIIIISLVFNQLSFAENPIRGFVVDGTSGEPLPVANVVLLGEGRGTATNLDGYFNIYGLKPGHYSLSVSYLGYHSSQVEVEVTDVLSEPLKIELYPSTVPLEEVTYIVDSDEDIRQSTRVSTVPVDANTIRSMPSIGAEVDLLRALQAIPGVKASSEMSSAIYVRGGSSDMTLILMDQSTVYNPSHLFGIFSTFNTDAVKHVQLMKGGFPAEYGGRAGSVLEVVTKEGNRKKHEGLASASVISARTAFEGPLPGKHGSYAFSGRRTYLDPIISVLKKNEDFKDLPDYYFYDANGKINIDINHKATLTVGSYLGLDNLIAEFGPEDSRLKLYNYWGNDSFYTRLRYVLSRSSFLTFAGAYSRYKSGNAFENEGAKLFKFKNRFRDMSLRSDLEYLGMIDHKIKTGIQFNRWSTEFSQSNEDVTYVDIDEFTWNLSWYLQDAWRFSPLFEVQPGVRVYYHKEGDYVRADPRMAFVYNYDQKTRFKFSTGQYTQFINVMTYGDMVSFLDIWTPNDGSYKPTTLYQYVLGFEWDPVPEYEFTVEAYYNDMHNVVMADQSIDEGVDAADAYLEGDGYAYGLEWMLRRKVGRWSGWLGYSLSWTKQKYPDQYFNYGDWFYPKWDRRHDFVSIVNYKLNKKWEFSGQWRYNTGQGYTQAMGIYTMRSAGVDPGYFAAGNRWALMGLENNYRLPADHRLDVTVTYLHKLFSLPAKLNLSVYNLYSRRSTWTKFYDTDMNPVEISDIKLLPILPLISYEVRW
ncbi:MAG: TonB-dependent receptor [Candidatus Electryonea clarkiae]|nr:TonB-dependent receptor [Candidatus Electryonea clarkiae]MDP8286890.1 TonB-dependent receptor [Candidatus Electryonea clarkiae]